MKLAIVYYPSDPDTGLWLPKSILVNPFAHEIRELIPTYDNFLAFEQVDRTLWIVSFSPNLHWALLVGNGNGRNEEIILWDMERQTQIASIPTLRNSVSSIVRPVWSPSGEQVLLLLNQHLVILNQKGEIKPVLPAWEEEWISRLGFNWSPDERFVVFWNNPVSSQASKLFVYDTREGQLFDTCLTYPISNHAPVWSPDGLQFFVRGYKNGSEYWVYANLDDWTGVFIPNENADHITAWMR